ncbi:MAG: biopolymer transporter ExbD [Nostocales cyanobacterium]|nr:MAG: biopolymer transporter ExbD [Nostocales cyanobacterium]TAF13926.1 MAG: biopolymer transporter ExbD [Nostocales cyanobacterium]
MRLQDEPDIPAQINIVPMIDVIFAILTYFIMSTLFLTKSESLPVNLPKASTAMQNTTSLQLVLTVDKTGEMFLNKQPIQLENLETELTKKSKPNQELVVVLNADESIKHGQVVGIMDKLRTIPNVKFGIATKRE